MTEYHCPDSCNKCKGKNILSEEVYDSGILSEAKTECVICGFADYWSYGFFNSDSKIESNCETYSFDHEGEA